MAKKFGSSPWARPGGLRNCKSCRQEGDVAIVGAVDLRNAGKDLGEIANIEHWGSEFRMTRRRS